MRIIKTWLIIFGLSLRFLYAMETIESFLGPAMVGVGGIIVCKAHQEQKKITREVNILRHRETVNSANLMRITTTTEVDVALVGTRPFLLLDDFRETPAERLEELRNLRVETNNFPLERRNLIKRIKVNRRKSFSGLLICGSGTIFCLKNLKDQVQAIDKIDSSLLLGFVCGVGIGLYGLKYVMDSINKDND